LLSAGVVVLYVWGRRRAQAGGSTMTDLGTAGPAESQFLYHFTGRNGGRPAWVPEDIRTMSRHSRLDAILREEQFRAFVPFGAGTPDGGATPCVCFSECTDEQRNYLINTGQFGPWALVCTRAAVNKLGGGTVAYVPFSVQQQFRAKELGHWAVRTESRSMWLHEREWRIPRPTGSLKIISVNAILIGDPAWRPQKVGTGRWVDQDTSQKVEGPDGHPHAVPVLDYPRLWRETPVWVWDRPTKSMTRHSAGDLR
jgi:hypothetical protein